MDGEYFFLLSDFGSLLFLEWSLVGLICFGVEGKSRWQWATSIIFGNGPEKR